MHMSIKNIICCFQFHFSPLSLLMFFVQIDGACLLKSDLVEEINQFQWYYRVFLRFCEHLLVHSAVPGTVNGKSIKDYLLRIPKHQLDYFL